MGTVVLVLLVLLLVGALPTWPYSSGWGYYPRGGLGLVVLILLILVLMGRIWRRFRAGWGGHLGFKPRVSKEGNHEHCIQERLSGAVHLRSGGDSTPGSSTYREWRSYRELPRGSRDRDSS